MALNLETLESYYGNWYQEPEAAASAAMSMDLYPYTKMFSPIRVNGVEIKNRLVMAPMGNINLNEENGRPSPELVAYFEERAKGGVGLITSGLIPVSQDIDPTVLEKHRLGYFPRISGSRSYLSGWRDIANSVHAFGSRFFIQLTAGLGRVGNPECLMSLKRFPRSASFNKNYYLPSVPCLRLSDRSLRKIIRATGQAAADAKAMMIDGVYLHAHEGYLMEQLANRAFNRRMIGRYADPKRFGLDMVREIRKRCGDRYPIMFRIDLSLMLNAVYGERMKTEKCLKKYRRERSVEESLAYMQELVKAGVDIFDVDLGCYDNWWLPHPPAFMPPGCFLDVAKAAKDYFDEKQILSNQGLPVPVVAVGKLGYPDLAEKALREGKADMIMLGRPLLADPYWPAKAYSGRVAEIRPCIGCQEACINEFVEGGHPYCTVNPRCSFEARFPLEPKPTLHAKRVAVIGAGPAGVECALTAAQRGHEVWLFDEQKKAGGTIFAAALHANKKDILNYMEWLQHRIHSAAQKMPNFHYCPETLASMNMLEDERFDAIVCATGAEGFKLPIPGSEKAVTGEDATRHLENFKDKKKIVIAGAGSVGCELAFVLADEPEREITIVELTPYVMKGVCTANRAYLIHYLEKKGVKIHLCSQVQEVQEGKVKIRQNVSKTVPDPFNTWTPILPDNIVNPLAKPIKEEMVEKELDCDLCVLAVGSRPRNQLYRELRENYCAPEIHAIGDAFSAATVKEAVRAGYRLGLEL